MAQLKLGQMYANGRDVPRHEAEAVKWYHPRSVQYMRAPPKAISYQLLSGSNAVFTFGTVSNRSYTIERNDDLATTNWVFVTNLTSSGVKMQVAVPVAETTHRFFRVRQP